jgi:hopanoid biosynthesis associated protein HpnK
MTIKISPTKAAANASAFKHLVVTADDFGLAPEVNAAVEAAHRSGILSAASLMVSAPAAQDAITRALDMPGLRVGLHLVLVDGRPTLPPHRIPNLVDANGELRRDIRRLATELACRSHVRDQLRAEITAQFAAFERTGLTLDHVNLHKHFHLHPFVAKEVIAVGQRFGMRTIRVPIEPRGQLARSKMGGNPISGELLRPWAALLARRARRAGLIMPDAVFGMAWSGKWTTERLSALIRNLSPGMVEIYLHPALSDDFIGHAPLYHYKDEFNALTAPDVAQAVRDSGFQLGGYNEMLMHALS